MKYLISSLFVIFSLVISLNVNSSSLDEIIAGKHRSEENTSRDEYRHPKETIEFFGTKPTDHVLEMWPGTGWYSEILAPYVKDHGQFTAVTFGMDNLYSDDKRAASWSRTAVSYIEKMSDKELYGDVIFQEFEPPQKNQVADPNTVDVAYAVRTIHIWDEKGILSQGFKSLFNALKPGGILAVVQHRGNALTSIGSSAVEGYLDERYVIEVAESVGFKFVDRSEINANLKDTKDYPKGVYALLPTLAMGQHDKDKYISIGESDRMTLKFIKKK